MQKLITIIQETAGEPHISGVFTNKNRQPYRYRTYSTTDKRAVKLFRDYRPNGNLTDSYKIGINTVYLEREGKPQMFGEPLKADTVTLKWLDIL